MRIVCISDTHSLHNQMRDYFDLPEGDVLIHSGDCTSVGKKNEVEEFVYWFQNLKGYDTKIFIAGNHDFAFEQANQLYYKHNFGWFHNLMTEENLSQSDVVYLEDSEYLIQSPEFSRPIKIYGSPWQPEFYNWAFNLTRNGPELEEKWNKIPNDTDILITHGPPHGFRDFTPQNLQVGCEILRNRIEEINPTMHVFGHIHHGYGAMYYRDIMLVNASICDESYIPKNKPIVVDINEYEGKLITSYVEI